MAKIMITPAGEGRFVIEFDPPSFAEVKIREEVTRVENAGIRDDEVEVICAIKEWLFDKQPRQLTLDIDTEKGSVKKLEPNEWNKWVEAFQIFAKYSKDGYCCAEHDEILAGSEVKDIAPADEKRLEELGWVPAREGGYKRIL